MLTDSWTNQHLKIKVGIHNCWQQRRNKAIFVKRSQGHLGSACSITDFCGIYENFHLIFYMLKAMGNASMSILMPGELNKSDHGYEFNVIFSPVISLPNMLMSILLMMSWFFIGSNFLAKKMALLSCLCNIIMQTPIIHGKATGIVTVIYRIWNEFSFHTVFMKQVLCFYIPKPLARVYKTHEFHKYCMKWKFIADSFYHMLNW